jgi:hypothetical protein
MIEEIIPVVTALVNAKTMTNQPMKKLVIKSPK